MSRPQSSPPKRPSLFGNSEINEKTITAPQVIVQDKLTMLGTRNLSAKPTINNSSHNSVTLLKSKVFLNNELDSPKQAVPRTPVQLSPRQKIMTKAASVAVPTRAFVPHFKCKKMSDVRERLSGIFKEEVQDFKVRVKQAKKQSKKRKGADKKQI